MSVIVDQKQELMTDIQDIYYKNATVFLDEESKIKFDETKSDFLKFLERD